MGPKVTHARAVVLGFLVAGVVLFFAYARATPFDRRTHDLPGHLEHVDYIVANHAVPKATACWECYQPPAYYALAAAVLELAPRGVAAPGKNFNGLPDVARANARTLQTLSVVLTAFTLLFQLLAVREMARGYAQVVASAMVTFWPALSVEGCKLGNDTLLYVFASAALWLLVRWRRTGSARCLALAAAAAGLAANTKLSGVVLVVAVAVAVALAVARSLPTEPRVPRGAAWAALVLALSMAALVFTVVSLKQGMLSNDSTKIGDNQNVPSTLATFARVSLKSFAHYPYANMTRADTGHVEFWNYLFRTSLFSEEPPWPPKDALLAPYAGALAGCAVVLFVFVVAGFVRLAVASLRRTDRGGRELVLVLLGLLAAIVLLRARVPLACSNDFRYIVPVIGPCAVMMATAMDALRERLRRRWMHLAALPGWLVVAFCGLSTLLLLNWV